MYIAIINYNMGNIKSVENAFLKIGANVKVTSSPYIISSANAIVLPGVGAFRDAMKNFEELGLTTVIRKVLREKLFLGICLGMQLLFEYSMEDGKTEGLGVLEGTVERIPPVVKVPHMGWNQVSFKKPDSKIFGGIRDGEYFYFVHSYHVVCKDASIVSSVTHYGTEIVSSIESNNIYAFQFHPEKSSVSGLRLLENFWNLVKEESRV
ncbi:MAG: imidazole glycerol phosphate synthase subunit HisH [Actinobacteria bacterium]|nr:imidazole glycerol phosphate synthase subunit HisH [Actinomycetota bacterium]